MTKWCFIVVLIPSTKFEEFGWETIILVVSERLILMVREEAKTDSHIGEHFGEWCWNNGLFFPKAREYENME